MYEKLVVDSQQNIVAFIKEIAQSPENMAQFAFDLRQRDCIEGRKTGSCLYYTDYLIEIGAITSKIW